MAQFLDNSIFWIELDKIKPNPYQPRKEFEEANLKSLAESIRQYGVLQALVVTRREEEKPEGGLLVYYELISGERRLRASRIAGLSQVPVLIKTGDDSNLMKLELAIIENLQREDLNPIERALAFQKLAVEFGLKPGAIGEKVGKSREYVANTLRILDLPEEVQDALGEGKITEGHTRPLGMLRDKPEEQRVLLKEIIYKKLTVREAEQIARTIATDKVRKQKYKPDPEYNELEHTISESLGTRVHIAPRENGGKIEIDFFTKDDLYSIIKILGSVDAKDRYSMLERFEKGLSEVSSLEEEALAHATPLSITDDNKQQFDSDLVSEPQAEQEEEPLLKSNIYTPMNSHQPTDENDINKDSSLSEEESPSVDIETERSIPNSDENYEESRKDLIKESLISDDSETKKEKEEAHEREVSPQEDQTLGDQVTEEKFDDRGSDEDKNEDSAEDAKKDGDDEKGDEDLYSVRNFSV